MSKIIRVDKPVRQAVLELFRYLLKEEKVKGVFSLGRIGNEDMVSYFLYTDPESIDDALPFYPLMPVNAAKALSRFSLLEPSPEPVAAIVRPCEERAFVELVKRHQGSLENLLLIGFTCSGVFPLEMAVEGNIEAKLPAYWESAKKAEIPEEIRPSCQTCTRFVPVNADITIPFTGRNTDNECEFILNTTEAETYLEGFGELHDGEPDAGELTPLLEKRKAERKKYFEDLNFSSLDLSGLVKIFGRCLSCYNCREVCPICYCNLCEFVGQDFEVKPVSYQTLLDQKGGCRLPPNTLLFHLGRMIHMAYSCVGCGMCTDVCPADIPVSAMFSYTGEGLQDLFDYVPGKSLFDEPPLMKFEREELAGIAE
ncbi:MAG: Coenzyme F420 hydrogenase/dehydrogenase, beta subunit C-terminal domain [Candidatus Eremiobacteraeota bacterium]|nr:Coenzyme F420 hydrogenase/dehydrogenase, beta subunit C-terminal domain [Candidatus Eremiobacteraeota bacterium]